MMQDHLETTPNLEPLPTAEQLILQRAMSKQASQRYPSCGAFVKELIVAVTPEPKAPTAKMEAQPRQRPPEAEPIPPVSRRSLLRSLLIGAVGAVVAGTGVFAWLHRTEVNGLPSSDEPGPPPNNTPWLPPEGDPAEGAQIITTGTGQRLYNRIDKKVGSQRVRFHLIAQESNDPARLASFYLMQTKVWNALYGVAVEDQKFKDLLKEVSAGQPASCRTPGTRDPTPLRKRTAGLGPAARHEGDGH